MKLLGPKAVKQGADSYDQNFGTQLRWQTLASSYVSLLYHKCRLASQ